MVSNKKDGETLLLKHGGDKLQGFPNNLILLSL